MEALQQQPPQSAESSRVTSGSVQSDESRAKVERLESAMSCVEELSIPIKSYFANGLYAREVTLKAGTLATSLVHKVQHLCVISSGKAAVFQDDVPRIVEAPCMFVTEPGTKRAVYAITDVTWTTIHANPADERNLEVLEAQFVEPKKALVEAEEIKCLG